MLVLIGSSAIAPFLYLLLLSFKSRLDFLEVPPTLHFDWATIKENYAQVIHDDHYFTFVENSIIVTGISTLIALVLGVPAALRLLAPALPRQRHVGVDDPQLPLHAAGRGRDPDLPDDPLPRASSTATSG